MTKYKSGLKAQIVHKYLSTFQSTNDLGEKHQISGRRIAEWVQRYQLKGESNALKNGVIITTDFKLNMMAEVAACLDILTAQFLWSLCLIVSDPLFDFSSWL